MTPRRTMGSHLLSEAGFSEVDRGSSWLRLSWRPDPWVGIEEGVSPRRALTAFTAHCCNRRATTGPMPMSTTNTHAHRGEQSAAPGRCWWSYAQPYV